MSKFDFLYGREDVLYEMCKQVEKYQNVDTDIFMLKCRRALEQIVTKLGCQGHTLREKVDDINSKLNISRDMKNRIIKFKNLCNESIHYDEGKTASVAVDSAVAELVDICKWLVDAKIEKKVETVIESNIKLLQEKQRDLEKAFKNNDMTAVAKISDEIKNLSQTQNKDINNIKEPSEYQNTNKQINKKQTICSECNFSQLDKCYLSVSAFYLKNKPDSVWCDMHSSYYGSSRSIRTNKNGRCTNCRYYAHESKKCTNQSSQYYYYTVNENGACGFYS